jgi:hypothetical protein
MRPSRYAGARARGSVWTGPLGRSQIIGLLQRPDYRLCHTCTPDEALRLKDKPPAHVGRAKSANLGRLIAMRCLHEVDAVMCNGGSGKEPGTGTPLTLSTSEGRVTAVGVGVQGRAICRPAAQTEYGVTGS